MTRNRKQDAHYPVRVEAGYTLRQGRRLIERGRVLTVGLNGTELVVESAKPWPSGLEVELVLNWPAPASSDKRIAVRIKGRTAGNQRVRIGRYDFDILPERTTARAASKETLPHVTPLAS